MLQINFLKIRTTLIPAVIVILFTSCSAKIYTKKDATRYTSKHNTVAIIPPKVKIEVRKRDNDEKRKAKQEQEVIESQNAQNEEYSRLLQFVRKGKMHLEIQDIEKTNAILLKINCPNGDCGMAPEQLAQALGVDAIIESNYVFSSQKNIGLGITYAIIFFPYLTPLGIMMACSPTNRADLNIKLVDGTTGYLLYSYNNKLSRLNKKFVDIVDKATKKAGKKIPYH
ncbi:hypothetical protein [Parafilimonas sp.]|uniref:hypothetical protein n=1 Tax=Parafilimonas sp. TaxID=1969739 RepID=UPI0039E3AF21